MPSATAGVASAKPALVSNPITTVLTWNSYSLLPEVERHPAFIVPSNPEHRGPSSRWLSTEGQFMLSRIEQYRHKAEEAERKAGRCADAAARDMYQEIARQWREMVERAERSQQL
jgi:hypothetical protein